MSRTKDNTFDFGAHEEKVDRTIQRLFAHSYMSNSKWRKLFETLDRASPDLQVIWKFVDAENAGVRHALPPLNSLGERYLNDGFWFGPRYYKEIEWIEFPNMKIPAGKEDIPFAHIPQDLLSLRKVLDAVGSWELEETTGGVRLYGHKPPYNQSRDTDAND